MSIQEERGRPSVRECKGKASYRTVRKALSKKLLPHVFKMTVGDWSDDGHGKTETFFVSSNKPFKNVISAYRKAKVAVVPSSIFNDFEESSLSSEDYLRMFDDGYDMLVDFNEPKERARRAKQLPSETWQDILDCPQIEPVDLVYYIIWCCQRGDPKLKFSVDSDIKDLFGYYGASSVGYGLFNG